MLAAGLALALSSVAVAPDAVSGFSRIDITDIVAKKPVTDPMLSFLGSTSAEREWGRSFARRLSADTVCEEALCGDEMVNSDATCDIALCGADDVVYDVSVVFQLAGTVDSFGTAERTAFKDTLAAQLAGVSASDISLTVTSASIRIVAVVSQASTATLGTLQSLKDSGAASLSTLFGVTVESMSTPTIAVASPPSPPAGGSPVVPIVITLLVVAILASGLYLVKMRRKSSTVKVEKYPAEQELAEKK